LEWLQSLGYLGVFAGAVIEGEIVLITFIQLARLGYLNLYLVIGLFSLGTLVTDWTCFFIGRKNGRRYIINHPKLKGQFEKMDRLMHRRKQWLLLTYRFMYGFRFILPILFGFSSVRIRQFIFYSVLGNIVWVGCFASLGYFFSELALEYLERIQANLLYIFVMAGAVVTVIWFFVKGRFIILGRKRK
jgi:membrane protein DedA with SNARE-associated domain